MRNFPLIYKSLQPQRQPVSQHQFHGIGDHIGRHTPRQHKAYPNAASLRYHLDKLLETALAGATVVGLVVSLLFAFTLWG
jgi:hypothetical protein